MKLIQTNTLGDLVTRTLLLVGALIICFITPATFAQKSEPLWLLLGETLNLDSSHHAQDASISIGLDGAPIISWSEAGKVYVKYWENDHWELLGEALNIIADHFAYAPALAIDSSGKPVVTWQEFDGRSRNLYAKHWTGFSWTQLGNILDVNSRNDIASPSIVITTGNQPVIAWREQPSAMCIIVAKRWTGTNWQQLGNIINIDEKANACRPSLAVDSRGTLFISWYEWNASSNDIRVKHWAGNAWQELDGSLDIDTMQGAYNPNMVVSRDNQPVVAWREYDGQRDVIYVKTWVDGAWQQLGGAVVHTESGSAQVPSLTVHPVTGYPVLAWEERGSNSAKIYASYWNGQAWQMLDAALNVDEHAHAHKPSITFSLGGQLYVAWEEQGASCRNIYVKTYLGVWDSVY